MHHMYVLQTCRSILFNSIMYLYPICIRIIHQIISMHQAPVSSIYTIYKAILSLQQPKTIKNNSFGSFIVNYLWSFLGRITMAATVVLSCSRNSTKVRTWKRCSKQIKEQRARLYIIWKCAVFLLSSHDWSQSSISILLGYVLV